MDLKEKVVLKRGMDGQLLPVQATVKIDGEVETVYVRPLTVGIANTFEKFKDENSPEAIEASAKLVSDCYVEPKFSIEDVKSMKIGHLQEFVNTLLNVSGMAKKA